MQTYSQVKHIVRTPHTDPCKTTHEHNDDGEEEKTSHGIQPRISGEAGHFSGTNRSQYEKTWGFGGGAGQHTEGFGASSKSNVTLDPTANPEDRVGQHEDLKQVAKPDLEECAFESFDASVRSKAQ